MKLFTIIALLAAGQAWGGEFGGLTIDGRHYGQVVTAAEVYPDGTGSGFPTFYVYTEPGNRCGGLPRFNGRESLLILNGQYIWVVTADYDASRNLWEFTTRKRSVTC